MQNADLKYMDNDKIKRVSRRGIEKIVQEGEHVRQELRERTTSYIVGALGLVAGLAWNEAIKALIEYLFPLAKNTLWAKFLYAVVMTIVVGIIAIYLIRFLGKKEENK